LQYQIRIKRSEQSHSPASYGLTVPPRIAERLSGTSFTPIITNQGLLFFSGIPPPEVLWHDC